MRRKISFEIGEYYHIFNRGADKREIFLNAKDYERFILSLQLMNSENNGLMADWKNFKKSNPEISIEEFLQKNKKRIEPIVDIIAYCLNPNHYHLVLRQIKKKGIEEFMQKIGNGYAKYFNTKNNRSGVLFQGPFKAVHIDSNEYLLHVSVYVNVNNFIHGYSKDKNWQHSSLFDYIGMRNKNICNKKIILSQFRNEKDYNEFLEKNSLYLREKKELEKYLLD